MLGCRVCRGEACGSSERCTCGCCINCNLPSTTPLCLRCQSNQQSDCCHRHLPFHCYSNNSNRCDTCTEKLTNTQYRASIGNIVHETSIPTVRGIHYFDSFISANSDSIAALLDDYQRQYRYLSETLSRRLQKLSVRLLRKNFKFIKNAIGRVHNIYY